MFLRVLVSFIAVYCALIAASAWSAPVVQDTETCEDRLQYTSTKGTKYLPEKLSFKYMDSMMRVQEYAYSIVAPVENKNSLNRWASRHHQDGQTKLAVIRLKDNTGKEIPKFGAGFEPNQNMIMLVETKSGIETFLYEHETRHRDFDQDLRKGNLTIFAGFAKQSYEEFYTYPHDLLKLSGEDRLKAIDYVERQVLPGWRYSFGEEGVPTKHSADLAVLRNKLGLLLSGSVRLAPEFPSGNPPTGNFKSYIPPTLGMRFSEGAGGLSVVVNKLMIHEREFIGLTLEMRGLIPRSFIFAAKINQNAYLELIMNIAGKSWTGPEGKQLIQSLIDRIDGLEKVVTQIETRFERIRSEITAGRSGDEDAKALVEFVQKYRAAIQPAI